MDGQAEGEKGVFARLLLRMDATTQHGLGMRSGGSAEALCNRGLTCDWERMWPDIKTLYDSNEPRRGAGEAVVNPPTGTLTSTVLPDRVSGRLAGRPAQGIAGCPMWTRESAVPAQPRPSLLLL